MHLYHDTVNRRTGGGGENGIMGSHGQFKWLSDYVPSTKMFNVLLCFVGKLVNYMKLASMGAGVTTLTGMGIDRYQAVINPIRSRSYR